MIRFAFLIALTCMLTLPSVAQDRLSTKGTDFWFTFMENDPSPTSTVQLVIYVTADEATTATISHNGQTWRTLNVPAGGAEFHQLNPAQFNSAYQNTSGQIRQDRAIRVTATRPVTVYAFNTMATSTDAAIIFPVETLADEYWVTSMPAISTNWGNRQSEFAVVATEINTVVEITATAQIDGVNMTPGVPFERTLNRGDVFQCQSTSGDLTGTRVRVVSASGDCAPIAVFAGHARTHLPQGGNANGHDHLVEQMPPYRAMGQSFVITPLVTNDPDTRMTIRLMAAIANTTVQFGSETISLNTPGSFATRRVSVNAPIVVTSNQPVMVAQYAESFTDTRNNVSRDAGDPFLILVSPNEQMIDRFTFNAFVPPTSNANEWRNRLYLNLVARTTDMDNITVRGIPVGAMNSGTSPALLSRVSANSEYSVVVLRVPAGVNVVDASSGQGCLGYMYGYARADSYGLFGGTSLNNLRAFIDITDSIACPGRPTRLRGTSLDSAIVTDWNWFFPFDGTTANGQEVQKSFPDTGRYEVKMILTKAGGCAVDTVTDVLHITTPIDLTVEIEPQPVCWNTDLTVRVSPSRGQAPYGFSWTALGEDGIVSGASDSVLFLNHPSGGTHQYELVVTDAQGCLVRRIVDVEITPGPEIGRAEDILVCQNDTVDVPAIVDDPTGLTFLWSALDTADVLTIVSDRTAPFVRVSSDRVGFHLYQVVATNEFGCFNTQVYSVEVVEIPRLVNNGADPIIQCLEDSVPPITIGDSIVIEGGGDDLTYSWAEVGGGTASITGPLDSLITTVKPQFTTEYVLTVTASDGRIACPVSIIVRVEVRLVPDANAGPDQIICVCSNVDGVQIGEDALCGRAPYSYEWTPTTGLSNPTSSVTAETMANPTETTTYFLTVRDSDGNANTDTVVVFVEPCPTVVFDGPVVICQDDDRATLFPVISEETPIIERYEWSPPTFLSDPFAANPVVIAPDSTFEIEYTVTVTTDKGCMGEGTVTVRRSFGLEVTADASSTCETDTICRGDQVLLGASANGGQAPYTYSWSAVPDDPQLAFLSSDGSGTAEPLVQTVYTVTATDAFGCTITDSVVVCVDPVPNAFAGDDTLICASDAGVIPVVRGRASTCGKEPFVYEWLPAGLVEIPNSSAPWEAHLLPTETTEFILRVTDDGGNGNTTEDTVIVNVREPIQLTFEPDTMDICQGEPTEALYVQASQGDGPYTYVWTSNGEEILSTVTIGASVLPTSYLASLTSTQQVAVFVTDTNGCTAASTFTIVVRDHPEITLESSFEICPCDSVQIGAEATGGTPYAGGRYLYQWSIAGDDVGADPGSIRSDTSAITWVAPRVTTLYQVVAIDSAGCRSTPQFVEVVVDVPGIGTILSPAAVTADPRSESVVIPITVTNGQETIECPPDMLEFSISYNERLYDPFPEVQPGTIISNSVTVVEDVPVRTLRIRIAPPPSLTVGSSITTLKGKALIGDPGETPLEISDVAMIYACDAISAQGGIGSLTLDSLCFNPDGSPRLVGYGSALTSVRPNPSDGRATVTLRRIGTEPLDLIIVDAGGKEVERIPIDPVPSGNVVTATVELNLDVPVGSYSAMLSSQGGLSVVPFVIVK